MKLQLLESRRYKPLAAATAALLLVASAARADVESGKFIMSGFTDAVAGPELAAGDYAAVIDKLTRPTDFDVDEVAASTNLCVAYVASGQLDAAVNACDEAITMARLEEYGATLADRLAHQNALTIAYANRAVLTKLAGG